MGYTTFKKLHEQPQVLVLGNVWDAQSAKLAQEAGFKALGTSSHAIANVLGYPDGERISVDEILFMVERIVNAVNIPVSVDFEAGYSDDPEKVAAHVQRLLDIGVIGINLEDGKMVNGTRKLSENAILENKIKAIKAIGKSVFINARIDTFTTKHKHALEESIKRSHVYEKAGADGLFIPLAETKSDILALVAANSLPINLFLTPHLPSVQELAEWGIKRLSHGAKIYEWLVKQNKKAFGDFADSPALPK